MAGETQSNSLPLDGVPAIDLSQLVAGNLTIVLLADFGADVIKVEHPERGDDLRRWSENGVETWWTVYGRKKRSLELDWKAEASLAALKDLVKSAHVLVENFVPGKLETLGLGPDVLHALNPELVIVSVNGWGQTGPYKHKPGFGTLVEAMSGSTHLNGYPDKPPALPPLAMSDMYGGIYGAFGTLAALREADRSGRGPVVDVSLFERMFATIASEAVKYAATGQVSERQENQAVNTAPRNVYGCSDGKFVALSASVQTMFKCLASAIDRADLVDDPRFVTNKARVTHCDALHTTLADYFGQRPADEKVTLMEEARATVAPVMAAGDLVNHHYAVGRVLFSESTDTESMLPVPAVVSRLSKRPGTLRPQAPSLGAHTEEILDEIAAMREKDAS